jgi:hypothetical protein
MHSAPFPKFGAGMRDINGLVPFFSGAAGTCPDERFSTAW